MDIIINKIVNINTLTDFKNLKINNKSINKLINKPIYYNNYLFHYLIIFNKLNIIKLCNFPIYKENEEGLNGFFLAAKYNYINLLIYLIHNYPQYIYNKNSNNENFIDYLDYSNITKILHLKLNWHLLLYNNIDELYYNLNNNNLNLLLSKYKPNHYVHMIIFNEQLTTQNIINILDILEKYINLRDNEDKTIIFPAIYKKDITLLNYIISKKVDIDYYTFINTYHPLKYAINNNFLEGAKIIWNTIKNNFNYELTNNKLETFAYFLLNNNYIDNPLFIDILQNSTSLSWNQYTVDKLTTLHLLINYDFNKYNYLIKNIKIDITILKKIKKTKNNIKWYKFMKKLPLLKPNTNIIFKSYPYVHSNLFQSKFKDMYIYLLYIKHKYNNLYCPMLNSNHQYINLNYYNELNIDWPDPLLEYNNNKFPWLICYKNEDEYWIHQQLNNLINIQRRYKKYDLGFCYLSLKAEDNGLHANIIIYDFNNYTIERFDPYGDTVYYDNKLDKILEEELTWNTGLTYIKPSDYMPVACFQTISDELNPLKQKYGDYGGYCLAWCIWYLEHRILNINIKQTILVKKLLNILSINNNSFMEYIRNYSNKLNFARIKYLKKIGISSKIISNIHYIYNIEKIISDYIIKK